MKKREMNSGVITMKKYLSLFVIMILTFSFVSCGGSGSSGDGDSSAGGKKNITPTKVVVHEENEGYVNFDVSVRNDTDAEIHIVSLEISCLDKDGNIVDSTYPQVPVRALAGQSVAIDGITKTGDVKAIKLNGYSFYDKDNNFVDGKFDSSMEPISITEENTIELSESKTCTAEIDGDVSLGGDSALSVEDLSYDGEDSGFKYFSATIKNNGDKTINTLTVNFIALDSEGNICTTTYPQIPNRIEPGQTVKMDALTDNENVEYFTVDGYSYYVGEDTNGEYVDGLFPVIPKAIPLS